MGKTRKRNKHLPENMRPSHGAYYLTAYVEGKQKWIPLGREFGEALTKYRDLMAAPAPKGRTIQDLVNRFRTDELPKLRPSSVNAYKSWIPAIEKTWGEMQVADIRQPDAAVFLDTYKNKVTANRVVTLLTTMLKRAKRWGWIDVNYLEGLEKNTEERRKRIIKDEEWQALLNASYGQYRLLFRLARSTALRRGDICGLRWEAVRGNRLVVTTKKTSAPVSFQIAGELAEVISELKRGITPFPTRPIFSVGGGRPLSSKMLGHHFGVIREKAGVPDINFHDIRRTRITELTERYGLEFAQRVAAHSSPQTTEGYYTPEAVQIDWPEEEIRGSKRNKRHT